MSAKVMVEAANGPDDARGRGDPRQAWHVSVPDVLANAGGVVASYFEWAQDLQGITWERDLFKRRLRDGRCTRRSTTSSTTPRR